MNMFSVIGKLTKPVEVYDHYVKFNLYDRGSYGQNFWRCSMRKERFSAFYPFMVQGSYYNVSGKLVQNQNKQCFLQVEFAEEFSIDEGDLNLEKINRIAAEHIE